MNATSTKIKAPRAFRAASGQGGFSLVELLIALVIFLIVTATVYGLLEVGRVSRNRSSRRSDILKNARVAVQLIGRDALNAGLGFNRNGARVPDNFLANRFGLPPDPDTNRDLLSSIVVGNDIFTNNLSANPATRTDTVAFCYRDLDFNPPPPPVPAGTLSTGRVMFLADAKAQTGNAASVELVAQDPTNLGNIAANAKVNDLYLVENDTAQAVIMATTAPGTNVIDAAPGDPLGMNQALNGTGSAGSLLRKCASSSDTDCMSYVANLTRFFLVSYKVKPDGTLVRTVYGNNRTGVTPADQIQEQPLAYNIEDLQLKYVLDDGTVTDDPVATTGSQQAPNRIRQIMVVIKVQSTEIDEQTRKAETITLEATFSTRNMEYDAG